MQRKKNFEERVAAILDYIKNISNCRSTILAAYFNAATAKLCGICDNCINQKELIISKEEFESITAGVLQLIKDTSLSLKNIQQQLQNVKKEKLWKVINYLLSENKIAADKEGNIFI